MTKRGVVIAASIGWFAWASPPAHGQEHDFTFVVPVEITSLDPGIAHGRVSCSVSRSDPLRLDVGYVIATGATTFDLHEGSYVNDVVVTADAEGLRGPWEGRTYLCVLFLTSPRSPDDTFMMAQELSYEGSPYFFEEARLAPGMPSRFQVEGPLPR
jgi:hypothetical protein